MSNYIHYKVLKIANVSILVRILCALKRIRIKIQTLAILKKMIILYMST